LEVLAHQVDQARNQGEAGNQEEQGGYEARLMGGLDAEEVLGGGDEEES